jgi:hypothetical protein
MRPGSIVTHLLAATPLTLALLVIPAHAGVPSPGNSTCPAHIALVGRSAAGPDTALGAFTVIARHLSNNPWNEGPIWLDLHECPDCRVDASAAPNATRAAQCPNISPGYSGGTDGLVRFTVVGGSTGHGGTIGPSIAWVVAGGVWLAKVPIAIYDLDGNGGLGAGDLSLWLTDFGTGQYIGRDDYDFDGALGPNDLSLWLTAYGAGASAESGAALCP